MIQEHFIASIYSPFLHTKKCGEGKMKISTFDSELTCVFAVNYFIYLHVEKDLFYFFHCFSGHVSEASISRDLTSMQTKQLMQ